MYVEIHEMSILVKKLFIDNLKKVPQPILVQLYNMFEMLKSVLLEKNWKVLYKYNSNKILV